MNRKEEYQNLMEELEQNAPNLASSIQKAGRRKRRKQLIYRPFLSIAAVFVLFVFAVNVSPTVAYACSRVPILKELAEAVTFSKSLTDAVENEYVQPMDLKQTKNDVTAEIAYLIVDQKQVNVFFRINSSRWNNLSVTPQVKDKNGEWLSCSYHLSTFDVPQGELNCLTIDFVNETVPDSMQVDLNVYEQQSGMTQPATMNPIPDLEQTYTAAFEFLLNFDPTFTATGKTISVNQTVELDGQQITITELKVYPTHLRVEIAEPETNTAWLKELKFYIETDNGTQFNPIINGITATGTENSKSMTSYRADSTYFYQSNQIKLVITGAKWLKKEMERIPLNLATGEIGQLPQGVALESVEKQGKGWEIAFRADFLQGIVMHQLFDSNYYDPQGNQLDFSQWSAIYGKPNEKGESDYFIERLPLFDYPYEQVWLCPAYSHIWQAESPVVVTVQS